jgi:hypothetical protein
MCRFSMTARDLSFLAYALEFISGEVDDKDETIRGYFQTMFARTFEDNFQEVE